MSLSIRRSAKLFVAICLSLALTTVGHAGTTQNYKPKPKGPKIVYLAIASVDPKAMTITVESKNSNAANSKTYKFTAQTKITVNGHDGTVDELKPGLQIRVGAGSDVTVAEQLTATNPPPDPK